MENGKGFPLGSGTLYFVQEDPAVYRRFLEAAEELAALEEQVEASCSSREGIQNAHREGIRLLEWIFGEENDFTAITGGKNLMDMTENGQRVITNLLLEWKPLLLRGMEACIASETEKRKGNGL